jgi:NADH-quinone oxidoreductase subunit N
MFEVPALADLNAGLALPVISLALGATILLVIDLFIPKDRKSLTAWLALVGLAVSFIFNLATFNTADTAFFGMFRADTFSAFVNMTALAAAAISILLSVDYLKRLGIERGEFYVLLLFTTSGIMMMGHANNLVVVFIALELLSIPLYIMAAFRYGDGKSEESGMKYFILGAFASAFFVYGAVLVYGATGTTSLPAILEAVSALTAQPVTFASMGLLLIGVALIVVGLGFKVAAVPFHMWTPDVYEGAPTPVTAFMSVGAKIGGFAALLRILVIALPGLAFNGAEAASWQLTVALIAAATMILGNVVAVAQTNIKRLLAYSSIAHAGYVLMAVAAAATAGMSDAAAQAALAYLMAYMFTNLGAFAVAMALEKPDGSGLLVSDFNGLARSRPGLALMMAVFMLSLIGIPLTGGFIGKWLVFQVTIESGLVWLAVVGVLTSVVSAYYYVGVIVNMYLRDGDGDPAEGATKYVTWGLYVAAAGTVLLGVLPLLLTNLAAPVTMALALP